MPGYYVLTFGCQMNERDSEHLAGMCEAMGYKAVDDVEAADLIIINTCCVRESAEKKILGRIGQLKELKDTNPDLILAVCGCMVQQEGYAERLRKHAPHVDVWFGTHNLHELPNLIARARTSDEAVVDVWEAEGPVVERVPVQRKAGVRAFVNIIYGCNNFCTYCIVPYVRGRERSRTPESIYAEVQELVRNGYVDITLLGQNVNSYGKDLDRPTSFAELLSVLNEVEGLLRLRFTTSHPKDVSETLIRAVRDLDKVCEHIHLPVQAGGNDVLRRMNRRYTREEYLELATKIREEIPGVAITTDIIVGFPGETEEEFEQTLDLVRRVRFDAAFTFMYSPRSGTPAAKMPDQVPLEIKRARLQRLMEEQYKISLEINQQLVGTRQEVLIEGPSKTDPTMASGRTRTNKLVHFPTVGRAGRLATVEITEAMTWTLRGQVVEGER